MSSLKFIITSKNSLKVNCVTACVTKYIDPKADIIPIETESVIAQPINNDIQKCCMERIQSVRNLIDPATYDHIISLENGTLFNESGSLKTVLIDTNDSKVTVMDVCLLIHYDKKADTFQSFYSFGIPIDEELFKSYLQNNNSVVSTFGQMLGTKLGIDSRNWMKDPKFGGVNRSEQIENVLNKWVLSYHLEIIPNFPKEGVTFKSLDNIIGSPSLKNLLFKMIIQHMDTQFPMSQIDYIAGLDSRGYLYSVPLSNHFETGVLCIKKAGKVPKGPNTITEKYGTEYSTDELAIVRKPEYIGKNVIIIDDLVATGGTLFATINMLKNAGMNVVGTYTVNEVDGLVSANAGYLFSRSHGTLLRGLFGLSDIHQIGNMMTDNIHKLRHIKTTACLTNQLVKTQILGKRVTNDSFVIKNWSYSLDDLNECFLIGGEGSAHLLKGINDVLKGIDNVLKIKVCDMTGGKFGCGESKVTINEHVRTKNAQAFIIVSTRTGSVNDDFMEANLIADALQKSGVKRINFILPQYPYARSDKKIKAREPIAAKVVADQLARCNPETIVAIDLHAGQIQGYRNEGFHTLYMILYLAQYLHDSYLSFYHKSEWSKHFILVSPDQGGAKRIESYASLLGIDYVTLDKHRDYSKSGVVLKSTLNGDSEVLNGKTIILIDDIIDTGNTVSEAVKELEKHKIKGAILVFTHGVFSGKWAQNINSNHLIHEVVVTNTLPQDNNIKQCNKLRVVDCSEIIVRTIDALVSGKSISQLFNKQISL